MRSFSKREGIEKWKESRQLLKGKKSVADLNCIENQRDQWSLTCNFNYSIIHDHHRCQLKALKCAQTEQQKAPDTLQVYGQGNFGSKATPPARSLLLDSEREAAKGEKCRGVESEGISRSKGTSAARSNRI